MYLYIQHYSIDVAGKHMRYSLCSVLTWKADLPILSQTICIEIYIYTITYTQVHGSLSTHANIPMIYTYVSNPDIRKIYLTPSLYTQGLYNRNLTITSIIYTAFLCQQKNEARWLIVCVCVEVQYRYTCHSSLPHF